MQDVESVEKNIAVETKQAEEIEMDELFDYINEKKNKAYVITLVTRKPRQIVGFDVVHEKNEKRIQKKQLTDQ